MTLRPTLARVAAVVAVSAIVAGAIALGGQAGVEPVSRAAASPLPEARIAAKNRDVVASLYALVDARPYDPAAVAALFADDYHDHDRPAGDPSLSDKENIGLLNDGLASGFPDAHHAIELLESTTPDKVVVYWRFTGHQTGTFFGIPPSGNAVDLNGVDIYRLEDSRIVEHWHVEELDAFFRQMQGTAA